jgi:hypothetical protein
VTDFAKIRHQLQQMFSPGEMADIATSLRFSQVDYVNQARALRRTALLSDGDTAERRDASASRLARLAELFEGSRS